MNKAQALVVDDEADLLELLKITLARMDVQAVTALTLAEARRHLERGQFDLCLTDMNLPDGSGIDLIRQIGEQYPQIPVAMITAHGSMESAVAAMKAGAFDFVSKPVDLQLLRRLVGSALKLRGHVSASDDERGDTGPQLLGESAAMERIRQLIVKLARNQAPVFITGESGTGKELAARLIHAQGPHREGRFVAVNCGAIPQDLVESELFGHKKGSFTGAISDKEGLFQTAEGGTLFLDEVADLPLATQVKLLRAIQEKSVRPVGAQREVAVDARIISASHRDLTEEVERGRFRQDLFYRINVIELRMPALRERPRDIPLLADRLLQRLASRQGDRPALTLSAEAIEALTRYAFPGNVRELENILERALALCEGERIDVADLYLPRTEAPAVSTDAVDETVPLEESLREIEKREILNALDATHWDQAAASKRLKMTPKSLRYRLARLGIE
ncbi:sigma-54-dependent transcriptional regulator [Thiocystis violascens]|uniref:Response regulator with CheY-like receiver, AAA-type ATPase, and DNA-binding domains n=1 Tax=Thiocystis violascens (strain ATCC 17096 / DSM 198 / 6111) TaxID=765911 RepID=I3YEM2_THIV6|nr:sigma-54 dependent transcriptional regulator [Thiocystis violascens]AFL75440.1 response regulator with CheY-like receiver, AAA-type ATPase, and DNA-binding domains [Thiocystis violascens DSM 198]